jgi:two-component sensor histidine kinase
MKEEKETWEDHPDTWVLTEKMPLKDNAGNIIGIFGISKDITNIKINEEKIRNLLNEKELFLKEVQHRTKNYLVTINSLVSLQISTTKNNEARKTLEVLELRVQSILMLYEILYKSSNFTEISLQEYIPFLIEKIMENFPGSECVRIEKNIGNIILNAKRAQPLGIIINELLTNIMKYAFQGKREGIIRVLASVNEGIVHLEIKDNGIGIPEDINLKNSTGLGFTLIDMLAKQLNGTIRIERGDGTRAILEFVK